MLCLSLTAGYLTGIATLMPKQNKAKSNLKLSQSKDIRTVILIEDLGSITAHEKAEALSKRLELPVYESKPIKGKVKFNSEQWQLVFTDKGLALRLSSEPNWGDIRVDFTSAQLAYRKQHGGGKNEAIAKAIGVKGDQSLKVLDCTAGMGVDSFVLASVGASVTMIERNPLIAALLEDGLERAQSFFADDMSACVHNMKLVHADAAEFIQTSSETFDAVYLDPMFPHKKKSAMVKKEMQAFQKLLGPDVDSDDVFQQAIEIATQRVVVKRPSHAESLSHGQFSKPSVQITTKKHRYDVYIKH